MTPEYIVKAISEGSPVDKKEDVSIERIVEESIVPQGVEIPKPDTVFAMNGIPIFTKKSISLLKGKAKSGKTTVTAWVVSNIIKSGVNVVWFDTEQGLYYASRTQFWILSIAEMEKSEHLTVYDLKIHKPQDRIKIVQHVIETTKPDFVIIDGIRDLIYDINDPEQSTLIATDLMRWAEMNDCHILNIIHENKGTSHARGHLGTEMVNKSECVLNVIKNDEGQTVCEPEVTRGEGFDAFAFERDNIGRPVLVSYQPEVKIGESNAKSIKPTDITHEDHIDLLKKAFIQHPEIAYSDLQVEITRVYLDAGVYAMGINKVKIFISWYVANGYLDKIKEGTKTMYRRIDKQKVFDLPKFDDMPDDAPF